MNKWKTKFSYWKFDKKILLLVTVSILIVTLTVAGVSLTFSIASMKEQSVELLQMQNNTVAESFKGSMDSYKEIVLGTIMDDSVQNYCRQVQKNELKTADIDAVYSKLENLNNMYDILTVYHGGTLLPLSVRIIKVTTTEERVLYQLRSLKKCIPRHMREANMRRKER